MFGAVGITLVDFKIEFGRIWDGDFSRVLLADEISPDSCRLWDSTTNEKLDKDRFRRDLGNVIESYTEVARRLGIMKEMPTVIQGASTEGDRPCVPEARRARCAGQGGGGRAARPGLARRGQWCASAGVIEFEVSGADARRPRRGQGHVRQAARQHPSSKATARRSGESRRHRLPGSNCDRDCKTAIERSTGAHVDMVWHGETALPAGLDLIVLRRLRPRRLSALRGDGLALAGDGGGGATQRTAAWRWPASATASRCCAKRGCCRARCCATRASNTSASRWTWRWSTARPASPPATRAAAR